ncbi:MAG: cofactor-independent phosphoglycerate mutase [Candidatus Altiarchaeales archaeon]|nr:cofactor-independent phosphoglycerate mutase [Candidatus Altiarchaeales archaeon]MBD3417123.1 cofactor-independent phosphoglycerate mutase [Candidatus Altiarchaeales archaeon]
MKYVIVVPDGMADRPLEELDGKTPVEAAETPNMDLIASKGVCGMATTFYEGLPYDSSIANMSILGFDPRKYFTGRGPLEAANFGVELNPGDVAMRCNLVTLKDGVMDDFTAGHISNEDCRQLIAEVNERLGGEGIEFYPGVSYRNLLVLRKSVEPSSEVRTRMPHNFVGEDVEANMVKVRVDEASKTADLLNRLTRESWEFLGDHEVNRKRVEEGKKPANSIWVWGAGVKPDMPSFKDLHGITGSLVSAVDLLKGLGKIGKMRVLEVEGVTGYLDTNYEGKADAAVESLGEVDFTYVHLESTDESGHEGNIEHKITAIEDIDKRVIGRMLDRLEGDYAFIVIPDHPTPIEVRKHTNEPVPYAVYDTRKEGDSVSSFSEREIMEEGSIPQCEALEILKRTIRG